MCVLQAPHGGGIVKGTVINRPWGRRYLSLRAARISFAHIIITSLLFHVSSAFHRPRKPELSRFRFHIPRILFRDFAPAILQEINKVSRWFRLRKNEKKIYFPRFFHPNRMLGSRKFFGRRNGATDSGTPTPHLVIMRPVASAINNLSKPFLQTFPSAYSDDSFLLRGDFLKPNRKLKKPCRGGREKNMEKKKRQPWKESVEERHKSRCHFATWFMSSSSEKHSGNHH